MVRRRVFCSRYYDQVSPRGATRLKDGHVWVYRSDIVSADEATPGSLVAVTDHRGQFLGSALYSSSSQIAVRLISHDVVADLPALLRQRVADAIFLSQPFVHDTNAYRVVFSEADFLPGLIVDRYHDILSLQILTQAMDTELVRSTVIAELTERLHPPLSSSAWTRACANSKNCLRAPLACCKERKLPPYST